MQLIFDAQAPAQRALAAALGLVVSSDGALAVNAAPESLDSTLQAARLHCLSKDELYFLQGPEELRRPLNHRNEAAAVSLLLQRISQAAPEHANAKAAEGPRLEACLQAHCQALWPEFSTGDVALCGKEPPAPVYPAAGSTAAKFHDWADAQGVRAAVRIASFGGLRGCAAVGAVAPGDPILSIPRTALIYDDTVRETDLVS